MKPDRDPDIFDPNFVGQPLKRWLISRFNEPSNAPAPSVNPLQFPHLTQILIANLMNLSAMVST